MLSRRVEPELLDSLSPSDPRAIHSRRDLRLINTWMGNVRHLARQIGSLKLRPRKIVELGTGDGTLMLKLASELTGPLELFLLDMQPVVSEETRARFGSLGCTVHIVPMRIQEWFETPGLQRADLIVANLFLHHFRDEELREMFRALSERTNAFISCDPRRWVPALWSTRLLWLLGCNGVTRYDACVSVRAGFRDRELSALWPADSGITLHEGPAGFSSHVFAAARGVI
jgi:hypothetical protein